MIEIVFLEKVLKVVGLEDWLVKLVMFCVISTNLSVIWNGEFRVFPARVETKTR